MFLTQDPQGSHCFDFFSYRRKSWQKYQARNLVIDWLKILFVSDYAKKAFDAFVGTQQQLGHFDANKVRFCTKYLLRKYLLKRKPMAFLCILWTRLMSSFEKHII